MFFVARLLYWPALLVMIPIDIISLIFYGNTRLLCLMVGAVSSSFILYCKTYDWLVVLALKRKRMDKKIGINTGVYFVFIMFISVTTFIYSYISIAVFYGNAAEKATVLTIMVMLLFVYAKNLHDAYKNDADDVLIAIGFNKKS